MLDVVQIFHLKITDNAKAMERLKSRALRENRLDDTNDEVIRRRLQTYYDETYQTLSFYDKSLICDSRRRPAPPRRPPRHHRPDVAARARVARPSGLKDSGLRTQGGIGRVARATCRGINVIDRQGRPLPVGTSILRSVPSPQSSPSPFADQARAVKVGRFRPARSPEGGSSVRSSFDFGSRGHVGPSSARLGVLTPEPGQVVSRATSAGQAAHRPYVADSEVMRELTWLPVVVGAILGIIFGASSLYLVLRVGMTVSASIPVAVLSITLFRLFSRWTGTRSATILENNIVQTTGSAGESIAFGVGVTMPALMILGYDMQAVQVMLVAALGGLLGILMMIPLRRAFIVKQHGLLAYPEGTACAKVLIVGEQGGSSAVTVFTGFGMAFVYQILMQALKLWNEYPKPGSSRSSRGPC